MTEDHTFPAPDPTDRTIRHQLRSESPIALSIRDGRGDLTLRTTDGPDVIVEMTASHPETREIIRGLPVEIIDGRLQIDLPRSDLNGVTSSVGDLLKAAGDSLKSGSLSDRLSAGVSSLTRGVTGSIGTVDIVVSLPHDSTARLSTGMGDISVEGRLPSLHLATGMGDVRAHRIDGHGHVSTGSGTVRLGDVTGDLSLKTGSGDIEIARAISGRIEAKTGMGDARILVAEGTAVHVEASSGLGERRVDLTPTEGASEAERTLEVILTSGKGDLTVSRA